MGQAVLTLGVVALKVGVPYHNLYKLVKRGLVRTQRAGQFHLIAESDIPAVRAACEAAGVIKFNPMVEVATCGSR